MFGFWLFALLRVRGHLQAPARTSYNIVQHRHPHGRSECKKVFTMGCDGKGKFSVSIWMLMSGFEILFKCGVPVSGPLLYDSPLYVFKEKSECT